MGSRQVFPGMAKFSVAKEVHRRRVERPERRSLSHSILGVRLKTIATQLFEIAFNYEIREQRENVKLL